MSTDISVANGATSSNGTKAVPTNGNGGPVVREAKVAATTTEQWTPADAARLYGIDHWGQGYFSVTPEGTVAVHPTVEKDRKIDLKKLVDELRERDIQPPLLVRFTDILRTRVARIHQAFSTAIKEN